MHHRPIERASRKRSSEWLEHALYERLRRGLFDTQQQQYATWPCAQYRRQFIHVEHMAHAGHVRAGHQPFVVAENRVGCRSG